MTFIIFLIISNNYFSFLQKFVRNAECGIASRLKLIDRIEEEHHQIIHKYLKSIERLEADNSEVCIHIFKKHQIQSKSL